MQKTIQLILWFSMIITFLSCDKEEPLTIDPPIDLCMQLGLGNMDEDRVGGSSFVFENNPNAPVDYILNCRPRVLVDVTIEPGTVIEFGENAALIVFEDGSFKALGTPSEPIMLRGSNSTPGYWSGIGFIGDNINNEMRYVTIDGAGGGNLFQGGDSYAIDNRSNNLKFNNCTIQNTGSSAFLHAFQNDIEFKNNTIVNNDGFPVTIHANQFYQLDGVGSSYSGNSTNMIRMAISPGSVITVTSDQTWQNPGIPCILDEGSLGIVSDLKLEAGFELVLRPNCNIIVDSEGSLNAIGTVENPIIIKGEEDIPGYWESFYVEGSSVFNKLEYVTIANGGRLKPFGAAPTAANLYVANGTENLEIRDCTISKSNSCGLYIPNSAIVVLDNITYNQNVGDNICK